MGVTQMLPKAKYVRTYARAAKKNYARAAVAMMGKHQLR